MLAIFTVVMIYWAVGKKRDADVVITTKAECSRVWVWVSQEEWVSGYNGLGVVRYTKG